MSKLLKSTTFIFVFTLLFSVSLVNKVGAQEYTPDINLSITPNLGGYGGIDIIKLKDLSADGSFNINIKASGSDIGEIECLNFDMRSAPGDDIYYDLFLKPNNDKSGNCGYDLIDYGDVEDYNVEAYNAGISYDFNADDFSWDIHLPRDIFESVINNYEGYNRYYGLGNYQTLQIYFNVSGTSTEAITGDNLIGSWNLNSEDFGREYQIMLEENNKLDFLGTAFAGYQYGGYGSKYVGIIKPADLVNGTDIQVKIKATGDNIENVDGIKTTIDTGVYDPDTYQDLKYDLELLKSNDSTYGAFGYNSNSRDTLLPAGITSHYDGYNSWTITLNQGLSNSILEESGKILFTDPGLLFTHTREIEGEEEVVNTAIPLLFDFHNYYILPVYLEVSPQIDVNNSETPVEVVLDKNQHFKMSLKLSTVEGLNYLDYFDYIKIFLLPGDVLNFDEGDPEGLIGLNLIVPENIGDNPVEDSYGDDEDDAFPEDLNPANYGATASYDDNFIWTIDFGDEISKKLLNGGYANPIISFVVLNPEGFPYTPDSLGDSGNPKVFTYKIKAKLDSTSKPSGVLFSTTVGPSRPTVIEATQAKDITWQTIATSTATTTKETATSTEVNLNATSTASTTITNNTDSNISNSTNTNSNSNQTTIVNPTFTKNLNYHSTNLDVKSLQRFLNLQGFEVATTGAGSLNNETNYNGPLTRVAIKKFQEAHPEILIQAGITTGIGTGYFGPYTRNYINKLLAENGDLAKEFTDTH